MICTLWGKDIRVIELFRVQDGKAAEHWDVTEEQTSGVTPFFEVENEGAVIQQKAFLIDLYAKHGVSIHRIITELNFTAVHAEAKQGNQSIAMFDIFQFEDNKLSGHWAVKQVVPDKMMHNNEMF